MQFPSIQKGYLLAIAISLAGCGKSHAISDNALNQALNAYFHDHGAQCIGFAGRKWPIQISDIELRHESLGLRALESAGLATVTVLDKEPAHHDAGTLGRHAHWLQFSLTPAADPYMQVDGDTPGKTAAIRLCWARKRPHGLVKWDPPRHNFDGMERTRVVYHYTLDQIAPWATRQDVQRAFPNIRKSLAGVDSTLETRMVRETSHGWEALSQDTDRS